MTDKLPVPEWIDDHVPAELHQSSLFKFKFELPGEKVISVNLLDDLVADYEDLEKQLEQNPAQYMFWAALYSESKSMVSAIEYKIARRRGWLTRHIVEEFREKGIKLTDKQLDKLIESDGVDEMKIRREHGQANNALPADQRKTARDLEKDIKTAINGEKKKTLPYLTAQLMIAHKNNGKIYHMVEAIRLKAENCRSLAGFKRQDKEQSSHLT
jgi:hypothetical protein